MFNVPVSNNDLITSLSVVGSGTRTGDKFIIKRKILNIKDEKRKFID